MSSASMRVLHLLDNLFIYSGITRHVLILSKYDSNDSYVCATKEDGAGALFKEYGINIISNKMLKNPLYAVFFLIKFCKRNKIDIVHTHHRYFDLILRIVNIFYKQKTICTVHSIVYGKKQISYNADFLIAVSQSVKNHLTNYFHISEKKITIVNNCLDESLLKTSLTKEEIITKHGFSKVSFKLGFFGKLSIEEKGIDILLEAVKQIHHSLSIDYELIIIGNGKDESYIKEFINKNNLRATMLDSKINPSDYYRILNCYVLPSNVDPFPYAMLESAYFKVPFIGSNVDGISEYIENKTNGLLFDKGNVDKLVQKILFIYKNPAEAKKLAQINYKKVTSKFVFNGENQIYNVYKKILSE